MAAALSRQGLDADVLVYGKNAVLLDYWSTCVRRFGLSANTSAILLENEGGLDLTGKRSMKGAIAGVASALDLLLRELRRAAPNALFVFVGWPNLARSGADRRDATDVKVVTANRWRYTVEAEDTFTQALRELNSEAELLFASRVLRAAVNASNTSASLLDGHVHPGPSGHATMGELVARLLVARLHAAQCSRGPGAGCRAKVAAAAAAAPEAEEECYLTADKLPLAAALEAGVSLRDEGGEKGVRKLGLVSTREGARLSLGPVLAGVRCGVFMTSLGYLQSWRPNQGEFYVQCVGGCACQRLPGAVSTDFPHVGTGYRITRDGYRRDIHEMAGMSVTAFTRFLLYKRNETACMLNVRAPESRGTAQHALPIPNSSARVAL